jgi:3-dehydroquinate dehydratase/shikimate dehydrogenase
MPRPLLCVSLTAATMAELRRRRDAETQADLVELRLDSVADPDANGALSGRARPVIVTCRPIWEGGAFRGSEEERRRILAAALEGGAEYVDIERDAGFSDLVRRGGRRVVLSTHDFEGIPSDLSARVCAMRAACAGVVKVAVTAKKLSDCLPLLELARQAHAAASREDPACAWIAMGMPGVPTRVLAARFGSCWTYAGEGVAPGQVSPVRLVNEFGFRRITEGTRVYGVVGVPLSHSVSPAMHNAAFQAAGFDAVYLPLEAADVDDFERAASAFDIRGASVTIPHKVTFFERLVARGGSDVLNPLSRAAGAVNTLRWHEGRWQGCNTDVAGFLAPLTERMRLAGVRVAVLGAGGAARAVAVALKSAGARATLHARNLDRAGEVARLVGAEARPFPPARGSWDLLVNATPVGMFPAVDDTPWPNAAFDGDVVYDLVYNPPETRFLRDASAAGCLTIGGLEMLVAQAQEQAEWWTGIRPPAHLLRGAALGALTPAPAIPPAERRRRAGVGPRER